MSYLGPAEDFFKIKLERWIADHPEFSSEFIRIQGEADAQLITDPFQGSDFLSLTSENDEFYYFFYVHADQPNRDDQNVLRVFLSLMLAAAGYRAKVIDREDTFEVRICV